MGVLWSRLTAGLLTVLAMIGFTVNAIDPVLPWFVLWLPSVAGSAVLVANIWRTARAANLPEPTRRFWRRLFPVAILISLGSVAQAYDLVAVADPAGQHVSPGQLLFDGLGIIL